MSRKLINVVMQGGGSAAELAVNTTWAELKAMRDNSQLTVGCLYRITDYETIISGADVQSAGHVFDIIVLATDVNMLSEDAMAVHSPRDTEGYFANSKLEAWELKYCLDNDTTRFAWASEGGEKWTINIQSNLFSAQLISDNDTTYDGYPYHFFINMMGEEADVYLAHLELQEGENFIPNVVGMSDGEPIINQIPVLGTSVSINIEGKGVIYHLKDEFFNECFYDFKNIQFARYRIIETKEITNYSTLFDTYSGIKDINLTLPDGYEIDNNDRRFFYTFSYINDGNIYDAVLENTVFVSNNIITNNIGSLNNIVFIADYDVAFVYNVLYSCNNLTFLNYTENSILKKTSSCIFESLSNSTIESNGNPMNLIIYSGDKIHIKDSFNCIVGSGYSVVNLTRCNNVNIGGMSNNIKLNEANNVDIGSNVDNLISFGNLNNVIIPDNVGNIQILGGVGGTSLSDKLTLNFITNRMITQIAGNDNQGNLKIWNPADLVQA